MWFSSIEIYDWYFHFGMDFLTVCLAGVYCCPWGWLDETTEHTAKLLDRLLAVPGFVDDLIAMFAGR